MRHSAPSRSRGPSPVRESPTLAGAGVGEFGQVMDFHAVHAGVDAEADLAEHGLVDTGVDELRPVAGSTAIGRIIGMAGRETASGPAAA